MFFILRGYRAEGSLMFEITDMQKADSIQSAGKSSALLACLGKGICSRTFAVVRQCLHGDTFTTVMVRAVAAPLPCSHLRDVRHQVMNGRSQTLKICSQRNRRLPYLTGNHRQLSRKESKKRKAFQSTHFRRS